jgi:hypothetical protein
MRSRDAVCAVILTLGLGAPAAAQTTTTTTTQPPPAANPPTTTTVPAAQPVVVADTTPHGSAVRFGLGGGIVVPVSRLGDFFKVGWQGQAAVIIRPQRFPVGFQIDGNFMQMKSKPPADTTFQVIDGTANIVFTIPTSAATTFKPYILGGAGVYNIKNKPGDTRTKFGLNGGVGFDVGNGPVVFFAEGRFHNIFSGRINDIGHPSNASFIPVTIGVKFGGQ